MSWTHEAEALTIAESVFPDQPNEPPFFTQTPRKIFAHMLQRGHGRRADGRDDVRRRCARIAGRRNGDGVDDQPGGAVAAGRRAGVAEHGGRRAAVAEDERGSDDDVDGARMGDEAAGLDFSDEHAGAARAAATAAQSVAGSAGAAAHEHGAGAARAGMVRAR